MPISPGLSEADTAKKQDVNLSRTLFSSIAGISLLTEFGTCSLIPGSGQKSAICSQKRSLEMRFILSTTDG